MQAGFLGVPGLVSHRPEASSAWNCGACVSKSSWNTAGWAAPRQTLLGLSLLRPAMTLFI